MMTWISELYRQGDWKTYKEVAAQFVEVAKLVYNEKIQTKLLDVLALIGDKVDICLYLNYMGLEFEKRISRGSVIDLTNHEKFCDLSISKMDIKNNTLYIWLD